MNNQALAGILRSPITMSGTEPRVNVAAPLVGRHPGEILHEPGITEAEIATLGEAGTR